MMNELINIINEHRTSDNDELCSQLVELIQRCSYNSETELEQYEIAHFTLVLPHGNIRLTDEQILYRLYRYLDDEEFYEDYNSCSETQQSRIDLLQEEFEVTDSIERKYLCIIEIFLELGWDLFLPYHAYRFIMEGKL